ncbi:hypothetical protein N7475_005016 [Penicillium sp. IBT 31633x]|nr:hypothetical protein N7475_005016 [Penicillium sp. IBT 31633x]
MRMNIISLVAIAATAAGLVVTSPRIGERIDPDQPLTIKWQAVETDPDTFNIELVNQNVYPPTTEVVASDVDSSAGSYTVNAKSLTGVDTGKGYQINFLSPTNGILAQSQQFRVTEPGALSSSSGKETSTALETSSVSASPSLSSIASTSDLTSSTPNSSSTASTYLSSTAHSSTSASTPTSSSSSIASSSVSTPTTSSSITSSSANIHDFYIENILHQNIDCDFHCDAYHFQFSFSLFNIDSFSRFLYYYNIYYPDHFFCPHNFFFHNHISILFYLNYSIHICSHLDFHIKHYFFYHISYYPHLHHHPCND